MGSWVLDEILTKVSPLSDETNFGNNFHVTFKLRYKAKHLTSFKEPPKLYWFEKYLHKIHHENKWWAFKRMAP